MIFIVDRNNKVNLDDVLDAIKEVEEEAYKKGFKDACEVCNKAIGEGYDKLMEGIRELLK